MEGAHKIERAKVDLALAKLTAKAAKEARKDAKPTFEDEEDIEFGPDGPEAGVEAGTEDNSKD